MENQEERIAFEWQNKFEDDFPNGFILSRSNDPEGDSIEILNSWVLTMNGDSPTVELIMMNEPGSGKTFTITIVDYEEVQESPRIVKVVARGDESNPYLWSGNIGEDLRKQMKTKRTNRPGNEPTQEDTPLLQRKDLTAEQIIKQLLGVSDA